MSPNGAGLLQRRFAADLLNQMSGDGAPDYA